MGAKLLDLSDMLEHRRQMDIRDDFAWYISPHLWTKLDSDSGSSVNPTISSQAGGWLYQFTGATNNNEASSATTSEIFQVLANRAIIGECRLSYQEANTSAANVAFGFADSFGANLLVDDGAGPKTSFSGALIYKVDGGTVWKVVSSVGTTQTIQTSDTTAGGTSSQTLRIIIQPVTSTIAEVTFIVNGVVLRDSTTLKAIKHNITYTSAVTMAVGTYVKAGSSTAEQIAVDYVMACQLRGLVS